MTTYEYPGVTKVYISGPMSDKPEYNFPAFREAAKVLRARGYWVMDPSERGVIEGFTWDQYLRLDICDLIGCTAVATLDGWEESRGSRLECHIATELGLPVKSVGEWVNIARAAEEKRRVEREQHTQSWMQTIDRMRERYTTS